MEREIDVGEREGVDQRTRYEPLDITTERVEGQTPRSIGREHHAGRELSHRGEFVERFAQELIAALGALLGRFECEDIVGDPVVGPLQLVEQLRDAVFSLGFRDGNRFTVSEQANEAMP